MDYWDFNYIEKFVCDHSSMVYKEYLFRDAIGYPTWAETVYYDFDCTLLRFANDKIRSIYMPNLRPGKMKGRFETTDKVGMGK